MPLFSPLNVLIAVGSVIILAGIFFAFGNQIFSPGDLSAISAFGTADSAYGNHADFEGQCRLCHLPLRSNQAALCTECHQNVGQQITSKTGVHGYMSDSSNCRACHPDHRGRDFEMVQFARRNFDHSKTRFPLDERHASASCQQCHTQAFSVTSADCATCHVEPTLHAGLFPDSCENCHQGKTWAEATWKDQPFDHQDTGFSLVKHQTGFNGRPITCTECHSTLVSGTATYSCQECHASQNADFMTSHVTSFGTTCTECHDGADRMENFNHDTVFPLTGRHAELVCANCHTGQVFQDSQHVCATCHQEPEIHAGFMGLRCQMCHTSGESWTPARLTIHEFPLDHGELADTTCTTCHTGTYTQYTCYSCHEHVQEEIQKDHLKAGISTEELVNCTACHLDGKVQSEP